MNGPPRRARGAAQLLAGRHFLVTGASSGIGAAIARQLHAAGADLILMGRNRARLGRVLGAREAGGSVQCLTADFAKRSSLASALRKLRATPVKLSGVIHCAGAFSRARLAGSDADELGWLMRVNVDAPIFLTLALRTRLSPDSDVIFVNSSIVHRPAIDAACYAATKHALRSLSDSLREEWNDRGVRVTSLFPGRTATPMQRDITRAEGRRYDPGTLIQPSDIGAMVVGLLALPRTIEVTDVYMRPRQRPRT